MWLVSRVVDYGYEGDKKIPLFVSTDQTFSEDWAKAAEIEAEAAATLKRPEFRYRLVGLKAKDGTTYTRADHDKEMEAFYAQIREICKLDISLTDSDLESMNMFSYECELVGVDGPIKFS